MSKTIKSAIEKLTIGSDDLVVFHVHEDDDAIGVGGKLRRALSRNGIGNTIVVCRSGTSVASLDPDMMAMHGWYRKAASRTVKAE